MQANRLFFVKTLFTLFLIVGILSASFAQTIKGKVFDRNTGEALAGANIVLKNTKYAAIVNIDGSYTIKAVTPGTYTLVVSIVGYQSPQETTVVVKEKGITVVPDFQLLTNAKSLVEVVLVGTADKRSDNAVRNIEKNSDIVQNILSEKTIQLLPDVTVANALQRVSGVTIQRDNSGEGRYAIIRGMAQRYNNTLVNGIKIPSPDDKYRFIPMDIFPSEMLERLEVIKALTPNMEGDAIGGTMNLVMKSAPDRFLFSANVSGGYSTLFSSSRPFTAFDHSTINKLSPSEIRGNNYAGTAGDFPLNNVHYTNRSYPVNSTMGATIGDRFLNKKLGVIVSASYQNFYKGANSQNLIQSAQPGYNPTGNTPVFTDAYERQYSTQTNRFGIQNKIDYVFNSKNKIALFNLYVHQNEYQTRFTPDTTVGTNSSAASRSVDVSYRSRWQIQDIYNATLQGDHQLSSLVKLNWSAVYSIAKSQVPDMASYNFNANVILDPSGKVTRVDSTTYGTGMHRIWQRNKDQDYAGYVNLTYTPTILNTKVEFETGGLYRAKTRDNFYNDYSLKAISTTVQPFHSIDQIGLAFSPAANGTGAVTAVNANTYTAHEYIAAAYIQAKFMLLKQLQILGGLRAENTQQDYTTVMPSTFDAKNGTISYVDLLPSVHLKYALKANQNIRLSYFKSVSRPGFGELVPYILPGEQFDEIGNPYLKHVQADNLDLRYELFPGHADQLLLGAFYKQLQNPIEYFVTRNGGPSALFIQPGNANNATNYGFEAVFTKYFGKFGVSANYTYTHSEVTTNKLFYHYVAGTGVTTDVVSQTRPLQGQADHVGNLSFLYKDPKAGLDVQIAFSYTGDRIAQVSQYYNLDTWQKPFSSLDLSFEKRLAKRFSFYAKINNLTNEPNRLYLKTAPSVINQSFSGGYTIPYQTNANYTIVQRDSYKLGFLGGFRYKF
ncbi:TonB-dependent receptor domain-containing protein [Parasediminibacterium paludis]|uniref:TonB-dependent receptor domain-containing protein n=1 Tax=Parasediminibacterium paludis TaxID=908966 RepID=A0ABV8Q1T2_9BACT